MSILFALLYTLSALRQQHPVLFVFPADPALILPIVPPLADSVVKSPDTGVEWRDEIIGGAGEYRILAFHAILLDGVSPIQLILCPF